MLRLILKQVSEDKLEMRVKLWERLFFLLLSLFFFILLFGEEGLSVPGLILALVSLAAGVNVDYWLFDREQGMVIYSFGFFPFVKKRNLPFSSLECFLLLYSLKSSAGGEVETPLAKANQFLPSLLRKGNITLLLNTKEKNFTIQTLHFSKAKEIEQTAYLLSDLCGIPVNRG